MNTAVTDIERALAQLAPELRRQRQIALLRPLNYSLIGASLAGLLAMALFLDGGVLSGQILVGLSLAVNLLVAGLERAGRVHLASYIFSLWVNAGVLFFSGVNLLWENNLAQGMIFACVLALSVMLVGLLLGAPYAFLLTGLNAAACFYLQFTYFATATLPFDRPPLAMTVGTLVPITSFMALVAIITWLYQRSLDRSEARLNLAHQRIMQDEILRRDLAIAKELQRRLYPPAPQTGGAVQIASRSEPARETSGDFYDFIDLEAGQFGVVVADVTGKSIAAALLMALARGTLRSAARRHSSPAEVLAQANEALCRDQTARQMITAFYGILDTRTLTLRFANAGHPYPVLRRGARLDEIELSGLPLGGRADARYTEATIQLQPGDQLFLLSDGLVEERNRQRELFGYDRLNAAILAADPADPQRALDELWHRVSAFREGTEQDDDITLVVIQAAEVVTVEGAPGQTVSKGAATADG